MALAFDVMAVRQTRAARLGDDVLFQIFYHLDTDASLCVAALVCRAWTLPAQVLLYNTICYGPSDPSDPSTSTSPARNSLLARTMHTAPHLLQFNIPLFIATDARAPAANVLLAPLTRTFPCTYFLGDFAEGRGALEEVRALGKLVNGRDGVPLGGFLMPFLDAMVAGRAWGVVGTERSTFSAFVTDILWRTYHGWDIVQRG